MTGHADRPGEARHAGSPPVTPPTEEPGRPGVVTAAVVVWTVLGALMIGTALLFAVSLVTSSSDPSGGGPGPVPVIATMLAFAVAGVIVVVAARRAGAGSRLARRGLTITGVVLAVAGLVQLTFLGVAGSWFVGFVVGAGLLHLPAARAWYARDLPA